MEARLIHSSPKYVIETDEVLIAQSDAIPLLISDQLVPLPSLFFIGKNGTPIEVVTSMTKTVIELEEKIAGALAKEGLTASPPPTAYVNTELGGAQSAPSSSTAAAAEPISASNAAPVECENGVCKIPVVDEKLECAKAVLAQQRKMKEAEEAAVCNKMSRTIYNLTLISFTNYRKKKNVNYNVVEMVKI